MLFNDEDFIVELNKEDLPLFDCLEELGLYVFPYMISVETPKEYISVQPYDKKTGNPNIFVGK
jgi:hypothetical protein